MAIATRRGDDERSIFIIDEATSEPIDLRRTYKIASKSVQPQCDAFKFFAFFELFERQHGDVVCDFFTVKRRLHGRCRQFVEHSIARVNLSELLDQSVVKRIRYYRLAIVITGIMEAYSRCQLLDAGVACCDEVSDSLGRSCHGRF